MPPVRSRNGVGSKSHARTGTSADPASPRMRDIGLPVLGILDLAS